MNFISTVLKTLAAFFLFTIFVNKNAIAQYGLYFNGSNQYATFGSAAALGSTTFTLECWFYKSGTGVGASTGSGGISSGIPLIAKGRGEADGSNLDMNYFLGINSSTNVLCADFEEGTGQASPGLNHPVYGVTPICNNVWYHAAATYDGTTWKIYLNGNLEATLAVNRLPQSLSIQHASLATALNSTGVASGFFNGKLDEVRIWNYSRTQADIQNNLALEISSATGLTGRYSLNENTGTVAANTGSAGTAVNGTLVNTPTWIAGSTFTPLNSNSSLQFGGTNSYVTFGNNASLGLSQYTLECWFRREGTGTTTSTGTGGVTAIPIISKGRNDGTNGTTKDINYFLGIRASDNKIVADFEEGYGQPAPGLNHPVAGVTVIQTNVWYHVAATYDGVNWKIYLNGNLESTLVVNRAVLSLSIEHAGIGSAMTSTGTASGFFNGRIDEARIWNTAKTQSEILNNINSQITTTQSGLVARWGMNDKCATTVTGIGTTTINGTITGSHWNWNSGAPFNIGVACTIPTVLSATSITSSTALLNWDAIASASSYNVQYRIAGTSTWTSTTSTANNKSISLLSSSSNYEWQVQSVCASGTSSFSSSSAFTTLSPCSILVNLISSSITSNSAQLNWTGSTGATGYNIQYKVAGTSTWTATTSSTNTNLISGLSASSIYDWQVQSICGIEISSWSSVQTFTTGTSVSFTDSLVATNAVWKYLDNGTNQGTAWTSTSFNDGTWASVAAQLGYGDGDEVTVVSYGPSSTAKYITTYFRKTFTVSNPSAYNFLKMQLMRDDGAVVYINGVEVFRSNMPTGTISYTTLSPVAAAGAEESTYFNTDLNISSLISGTNVIAVEVHQNAATSSDVSFKLRLVARFSVQSSVLIRGAYLNSVTPIGIVIRWRTDIATDSKVSFGTTLGSYTSSTTNSTVTTEHIVQLNGLSSATKYYYQIGNSNTVLQGDAENYFSTSPVSGSLTPVRIWALGDFGAATTIEAAVRDAYMNYTGSTYTNLFIWLGDNAYETGTDANYQTNVFGYFGSQFKHFPVLPAPGNHDYANVGYQSASALTTNWPYYDNFTMPIAAEAGGVASGSEKYYSYNYANIHFITLDSYGALNNSSSPMYQWLVSDLAANTQRWTIVYWHHPPYTKGTHNSDSDAELIAMRQNIIPLLEQYHVDLVLTGHSHVNERSYLIKGHYGLANTFTPAMKVNTATNTFTKTPPYDGTIYVVAGTGGKAPGGPQSGWPMPCMAFSNNTLNCSVVLDINGDNLSCKFIATDGSIPDQFTITKTGAGRYDASDGESLLGLNVFPNPSSDEFTVFYELMQEGNVSLQLMDITGREIKGSNRTVFQNTGGYQMHFNKCQLNLASGIYLFSISVNEKKYLRKVVIE